MKNIKLLLPLALLVSAAGISIAPGLASAEPGQGFQTDDVRLRLGLDSAVQANSNLFYQDDEARDQDEIGTAYSLNIEPSLQIETINPDLLSFGLGASANYQQFLSDDDRVRNQSGLSLELVSNATINERGTFSLQIEEAFRRTNEPPSSPATEAINRINNTVGATVGVHPGGQVIKGYFGYNFRIFRFGFNQASFDSFEKNEHDIHGRLVWQFLPRTAAYLRASTMFVRYTDDAKADTTLPSIDAIPVRVLAGLNGLILKRLAAKLEAGYGASNYESGPSFGGVIGLAALTYFLSADQRSKGTLSYERRFDDSLIGNAIVLHAIKAVYTHSLLDNRLSLNIQAGPEFREFQLGDINQADSQVRLPSELNDTFINAGVGAAYMATRWLGFEANYALRANLTDSNARAVVPDISIAGREFIQNIFTFGLKLQY